MTTRWEVEKRVLYSQLEPAARLIILALLAKADNDTALIPPEHTPSLTTIQAMTGLAKSTVIEWLGALEDGGWLKRDRSDPKVTNDRTQYALGIGEPVVHRPVRASRRRSRPPGAPPVDRQADGTESDSTTSGRAPSGPPEQTSRPPGAPPVDRQADTSRPPGAPATTKSSPTENSSTEVPPLAGLLGTAGETAAAETTQTILANFIDYCESQGVMIPPRLRGHYAKEIKTALDGKVQPLLVRKALFSMYRDSIVDRPSLLSNRIVHVQTGPERRNGQHQPHKNDPNADYHGGL